MSIEHVPMRVACLLFVLAAGCSEKRNPDKCLDGHCPDPAKPFCDEGGEIGGEPGACVAVECAPGEFAACRDDRAVMCNNTGDNYDLVECIDGCSEAVGGCGCTTADCEKHVIPKYLPASICNELAAAADLRISQDATLDVTNALNCSSVVTQTSGPEICVVRAGSITVESGSTFKIGTLLSSATDTRAVALVADRDVRIDGIIDVSADLNKNGPGGGTTSSGANALIPDGGGGAGGKTAGAPGGTATASGGAANGGAATTNPTVLNQLRGGARAFQTQGSNNVAGGGGGALTIVSCRGTVSIAGLIDAGGGGGISGLRNSISGDPYSAGGGGAGGTLVLQGMMVRVTGLFYANGGSGGGGSFEFIPTFNGEDGTRSLTAAQGAMGNAGGGRGGDGGVGLIAPTPGALPTTSGQPAGAGGGSVGFFLTLTPEGVTPVVTPLMASPAFEENGTVLTN
jgi:hypothetical protein